MGPSLQAEARGASRCVSSHTRVEPWAPYLKGIHKKSSIFLNIFLSICLDWRYPDQIMNTLQRAYLAIAVVLTLAVTITPIGTRALEVFTYHMIQHITLLMVVGSLLVLATPDWLRKKLNQSQIFRALTAPWISFALYATMMVGVHLPNVHLYIMHHEWAHYYVEVPLYLIVPYLFYFNILDSNLQGRRLSTGMSVIMLWLMMVPETLTGFFIYISHESAYGFMYDINDQRLGGTIMWSGGMIIDVIWIMLAVYHWWKSEELKSKSL